VINDPIQNSGGENSRTYAGRVADLHKYCYQLFVIVLQHYLFIGQSGMLTTPIVTLVPQACQVAVAQQQQQ